MPHGPISDDYMDRTADPESEALWAEFDAVEAAARESELVLA